MLQAGAARVDITPPPGQPMAGFPRFNFDVGGAPADMNGYFGRDSVARGVHDPLYARALVLTDGADIVAIVAVDLVMTNAAFTRAVRSAVQEETSIRPECLLIAASHTHSGPDLFYGAEGLDPDVEPQIRRKVIEAVCQAYANRRPARVGWADGALETISINRRDPAGPIDPHVGVMRVEDEHEQPIALVVNFAIHTCMLSAANLFYSADISGYAMSALERVYPESVALFLNGAAGNINPVAVPWGRKENVVPAFRQAWMEGRPHPRTFRNAARLGHILASVALQSSEQVQEYHAEVVLAGDAREVALPLREKSELERIRAWRGIDPRLIRDDGTFRTEVQALRIGPALYTALPGEPFVELGLELKQRLTSIGARAYVVGYANDDAKYILTRSAYDQSRYETWGSFLAPDGGEKLVESAAEVAFGLWKEAPAHSA